ncbi:hypothetical protein BJY00DRAFT_276268 [Aspergillus carlsbadensis]|nr:hypothetical protein BJY00DRAFT_276268 [Aspergillus carlsbadensis]
MPRCVKRGSRCGRSLVLTTGLMVMLLQIWAAVGFESHGLGSSGAGGPALGSGSHQRTLDLA